MIVLLASLAHALTPVERAQVHQLEKVRKQVANEIHFAAYDLVDELVYEWTQDPVFEETTPVVLASVTVPVGLGTGLQTLVENHLTDVLGQNPTTNLQLVHCPQCTAVVVHSGPEGTVVSKGIDNPKVLGELGADGAGRHALFVDIEAEGPKLVLRARVTRLTPELPIVWSHAISSTTYRPALLRDGANLKSAEEAREEYLNALRERGPISVPFRVSIRTFARPVDSSRVPPPPFLWIQSGVELAATRARTWTGSMLVGFSWIPQAYTGLMAQARIHRLISGRAHSVWHPDIFLFVGGSATTVWGPATGPFLDQPINAQDIIDSIELEGPRTTYGTLQLGLDVRMGNRIGLSTFLETLPDRYDSENIGNYIDVGVRFQAFGAEASFWF